MSVSNSYDLLPYASVPFLATHPDRLATTASLFGLRPARADRCRVLELGCAGGGNLIPMAIELPASHFVGVDLSPRHIDEGRAILSGLGLHNVELRAANILDVDASYGMFDYILCHGVYSWVPAEVQDKILEIFRRHLQPDGVGYLSYNTLPGWHMQGMLRDMLYYHVRRSPAESPTRQVEQARSLLTFLAQNVEGDKTPYSLLLQHALQCLQSMPDSYLFHEYLEECNEPLYFHQLCRRLAGHGLRYLAEADIRDMGTFRFAPDVRTALGTLATNQVDMEQYLDFLLNRTFRRTLLCHALQEPSYRMQPEQLTQLYVASCLRPRNAHPDLAANVSEVFYGPNGGTLECEEAIFKAALQVLGANWPRALPFTELARQAQALLSQAHPLIAPAAAEHANMRLATTILRTISQSNWMVELWQCPPRVVTTISERPEASPLARWQAQRQQHVCNLRHQSVPLLKVDAHLVPLLDGTRNRAGLARDLAESVANDKLPWPGQQVPVEQLLDQRLAWLSQAALLVA